MINPTPSHMEVRKAMFSIDPLVPNGFSQQFFHVVAMSNFRRNYIHHIQSPEGNVFTNLQDN